MRRGADILEGIDPRLREGLLGELDRWLRAGEPPTLGQDARWVLAGHRAAGKSSLLVRLAPYAGRSCVDLDAQLERDAGRSIRDWFREDPSGFRAAEREAFCALPTEVLVAVGGGFLSLHADLLEGAEVIGVPLTFDTFRERLLADTSRPRLRPELSVEEELREVFEARERAHRAVRTRPLAEAVAAMLRGTP